MEAFAIMGFTFGLIGFVFATQANNEVKKLKEDLESLRGEVRKSSENR